MAKTAKVNGKTIYLGANMDAVSKALGEIEKQAKASQSEVNLLERALKIDPQNVELLTEKQKSLSSSIKIAAQRVVELEKASENVKEAYEKGEIDRGQYLAFRTAVSKAESQLKKFKTEAEKNEQALKDIADSADKGADETDDLKTSASKAATQIDKSATSANKAAAKYDIMGGSAKIAKGAVKGLATVAKAAAGVLTTVTAGGVALTAASVNVGRNFETGMSEVSSISGATGEELDGLKEKAKEMGAATKFSASESAEAMKYMAMAGWESEQMIDGIDGVLNLAAASGEELGTTSDIVTDALTAFKMEAKDSSEFADLLAKVSSKANTNVSLLGESFQYCAPLAGTLGYEAKDVAVALGLMANSGIKGSKGGTSLNASLTNLAKPTKKMKVVMDEYGISLTDTNGKMLSLRKLLGNLREKFGGLSEAQQASVAGTLFGKEAMSGMLAIINASDKDFNNLIENVDNSKNAAKEMADTMNDNLNGSITIFKSAAEGFGIAVSEKMETPLRSFVDMGTKKINELKDAFEKDGFNGLAEKSGEIFADLATMAAENAPKMIDAGITFVKSFTKGMQDNSEELKAAALNVAKTLGSNLVSLLPRELQKPIKNAVKDITNSLKSGGLKEAGSTIKNVVKNTGNAIKNLTKIVLPPLTKAIDFLGSNLDKILPVAGGLLGCLVSYKILGTVTRMTQGFTTAIGLETGAVSLATVAQKLWNSAMSVSPAGLVITAVTGLIGVLGTLALTTERQDSIAKKAEEIGGRMAEAYDNAFDAFSNFRDEIQEAEGVLDGVNSSLIVSENEKQDLETSWQETQDAIGKVIKNASENRKSFTQSEIDKLNELFEKEKEIAKKKLSNERAYQTVTYDLAKQFAGNGSKDMTAEEYAENSKGYLKDAESSRDKVIKLAKEQYAAQLSEKIAMKNADKTLSQEWLDQQTEQLEKEYNSAINNANETYADTTKIIQNGYEKKATALNSFKASVDSINSASEQEEKKHNQTMYNLEQEYLEKTAEIEQNTTIDKNLALQAAEQDYNDAIREEKERHNERLNKINDVFTKSFDKDAQEQYGVWLSMITDTQFAGGKITEENQKFVDETMQILDKLPKESNQDMKDTVQGMINGLKESEPELYKKVSAMANSVINIMEKELGINSPSRVMRKLFGYVGDGAVLGLEDSTSGLVKSAKNMASDFVNATKNGINTIKVNVIPKLNLYDKNINNAIKSFDLRSMSSLRMPALTNGTTNNAAQTAKQEQQTVNNDNGVTVVINKFVNNTSQDIYELVDIIDRELAERAKQRRVAQGYAS